MKIWHIPAILMIVLIIGCSAPKQTTTTQESTPAAPPVAPPAATPQPVATTQQAPVETSSATQSTSTPISQDQATINNLKAACGRGAVSVCLTLKNRYGIDMKPTSAPSATP